MQLRHLRYFVVPSALPTIGLLTTPFARAHPNVTFKILSRTSAEIQRMLDDFIVEVGVTYLDSEPPHGVIIYPLYTERDILLTPTRGPFRGCQQRQHRRVAREGRRQSPRRCQDVALPGRWPAD